MGVGRSGVVCGGSSLLKVQDADSLHVEDLGLINPSFDGGGDQRHGEDHLGDLLVQSKRELANEVELVLSSGFHGQVLEVGEVLLEPIVDGSILLLEGSLSEGT